MEQALSEGRPLKRDYWTFLVQREELEANLVPRILYNHGGRRWLNKEMRVDYIGEGHRGRGIVDHGGGKRNLFAEGIKATMAAGEVFEKAEDSVYYDLKHGADPQACKEAGFFIGLAFLNGVEIYLPLPLFFFAKLKNHPSKVECSFTSLADVNYSLAMSLQTFIDDPKQLDMEEEEENMDAAFYWTVSVKDEGVVKELPVCQGGEEKVLKSQDVEPFVKQALRFLLHDHKAKEFEAFEAGFFEAVNSDFFGDVQASELKLAMCGKDDIDWVSLKKKAKYVSPYHANHVLIRCFWARVLQLSPDEGKQLLALW